MDKATIEDNAKAFLNFALPYKSRIKHMLWADWEYDTEKKSPIYNAQSRSNSVDEFCQIIQKSGFDVGVYANMDYVKSQKFTPQLIAKYPLWFARYTSAKEPGTYSQKGKSLYMWQYTSSGVVGGVSGYVDCNKVYDEKVVNEESEYYEMPNIKTGSIAAALNNIKVPCTLLYRKKIAEKNGISNYNGLYEQNVKMLELLKQGKLKKV